MKKTIELENYFKNKFKPQFKVYSPGRINLIGEHIDYNGGFVLPAAIDKCITFSFGFNESPHQVNVYNEDLQEYHSINLEELKPGDISWLNYIKGVLYGLKKECPDSLSGFDCTIKSNLPMGAGLSSSAALECGIGKGVDKLFKLNIGAIEMITLCREAEHTFTGTHCGFMDQFSVYLSEKDHFMLLNCEKLEHELIPYNLKDHTLVLLNTNVSHTLADSEYNKRRNTCEEALDIISKEFPEMTSLAETSTEALEKIKSQLNSEQIEKATYVMQEQKRVKDAVKAIKEKNIPELGKLMFASHSGLQHLYKVSCKELDFLVEHAKGFEGVLGARMMGGGFGGSTINLVHKNRVDDFISHASEAYKTEFSIALTPIRVNLSDGTRVVD